MRSRATAAAAIAAAALVVGGGTLISASAIPTDTTTEAAAPAPAGGSAEVSSVTVPLVTGDRVTMTTDAEGRRSVAVQPAPGRDGIGFAQHAVGEHLYVVPSDVGPLVPERIDRALFDVAALADAGFGDREALPVIVQEDGAGGAADEADGPRVLSEATVWSDAGITPEHRLESVGAVATAVGPESGAALADLLRAQDGKPSTKSAGSGPRIAHVWLDAPVKAMDADSMPQIGAPDAWDSGYTGEGVTLAVLDTGMDATHPDLTGNLVAEKDFAGTGGIADGQGHGTHVASIAAGSGAASDGVNQGVAPDADLMVGKVLDDTGHGEISWVIDGMEWAAEQGADVVNLSLGADEYTDGTDPASSALDALTEQYGTLFVVAAGNAFREETIASPGSASSALTVGSVGDGDQVSPFSSKGPRAGDGAIKPDVAAPGEDIVAARGAGTGLGEVVDDEHTSLSGTSMATPHVAGAAALLLQARGDLTPAEAKAALMGSAESGGGTVWGEGAGRITIPSAIGQQVLADPASVSFGTFEYPHDGEASETITYSNGSDDDDVLDLSMSVTGPDDEPVADVASLSADQVTVPAGGTATVDVVVDRTAGGDGRYSGAVVATGGDTGVRTPVGWLKEGEMFDLTVEAVGRDGAPHSGWTDLALMNVDDLDSFLDLDGMATPERTFRVPGGTYSATATLVTESEPPADGAETAQDDGTFAVEEVADVLRPEFTVDQDMTLTLDAGDAMPVTITTPQPTDVITTGLDDQRQAEVGGLLASSFVAGSGAKAYVTPTEPVTIGQFDHVVKGAMAEPVTDGDAPSYTYDLAFQQDPVTTGEFTARQDELATMEASYAAPGDGLSAQTGWGALPPGRGIAFSMLRPVETGTSRAEYVTTDGVEWFTSTWFQSQDSPLGAYETEMVAYEPGSSRAETFGGAVHSPTGSVASLPDTLLVTPSLWTDADGHEYSALGPEEAHLTVSQDGEVVADVPEAGAQVPLPAGGADYQVTLEATHGSAEWSTSPEVSAEWTFHAEPDTGAGQLMDVRFDVADIGLDQTAPATTDVGVEVTGGDGEATARLWWSDDDGATWTETEISDGVARIDASESATAVSLRAQAEDASGDTVEETVLRAYLLP